MGRPKVTVRVGFWYRLVITLMRPLLMVLTKRDWRGAEHLPRTGGVVVCSNHISHADFLTLGHFLLDHGRLPRYLAKSSLFHVPVVKWIVADAGQIPVYRQTEDAMRAYSAAVEAVRAGETVGIYPEGTLTRDPGLWPMLGKTGAARVALDTGAPVIPVAQWGPQDLLPPYAARPRLLPRKRIAVHAGPPVDLSRWRGQELTAPVLHEATAAIMAAITQLLAEVRDGQPPAAPFDPRLDGRPRTGNPNRVPREGEAR